MTERSKDEERQELFEDELEDEDEEELEEDEERELRLRDEILVDSYGPEEQVLAWYVYLDSNLSFPFSARCTKVVETSPLELGETVQVLRMASEATCQHNMFVIAKWKRRQLAVPLSQLEGINVDEKTQQAFGDWHYWKGRSYSF